MSGLGPAGVWAAQKRLESWARAARERTSSASSGQSHNSTDSFGDDKSHGSPHVSMNICHKPVDCRKQASLYQQLIREICYSDMLLKHYKKNSFFRFLLVASNNIFELRGHLLTVAYNNYS